jgi:hypothetical protein
MKLQVKSKKIISLTLRLLNLTLQLIQKQNKFKTSTDSLQKLKILINNINQIFHP